METQHEVTIYLTYRDLKLVLSTLELYSASRLKDINIPRTLASIHRGIEFTEEPQTFRLYLADAADIIALLFMLNKAAFKSEILEHLAVNIQSQIALQTTPEQIQAQLDLLEIKKLLNSTGIYYFNMQ